MNKSRVILTKILVDTADESGSLFHMSMTLPLQSEVDNFLKDFFRSHKNESFYLTQLVTEVKTSFGVSDGDAEIKCPHSHGITNAISSTRLEQFTHWGCIHLLLDKSAKRTGPNEYQHPSGPKAPYQCDRVSRKDVGEAMVSVKILKGLGWSEEQIMLELNKWPDEAIALAIKKVFS